MAVGSVPFAFRINVKRERNSIKMISLTLIWVGKKFLGLAGTKYKKY